VQFGVAERNAGWNAQLSPVLFVVDTLKSLFFIEDPIEKGND